MSKVHDSENKAIPRSHYLNLLMKDPQIVSFFEMNCDKLSIGEALDFLIEKCELDTQTSLNLIGEIYRGRSNL